MRITLLSFYSGHIDRGVEVYAQDLKRYLPAHRVDIISAPKINWTKDLSRQIARFTSQALRQLETDPPDILYPLNNGWQSLFSKFFCLRHKTKLVLGGHSGLGWDDKLNLWLFPDVFICFTHAQEQWAKTVNPLIKTTVIPHGVDLRQFTPHGPKAKLNLPHPIFLTVSAPHKNIQDTIAAVAQLNQGSLLVLGSVGTTVPHNIIDQYYRAADVFTLASSPSEAFGISYLEAMACNLPVVATDDPIRREIIDSAGLFIENPHRIAEYATTLKAAAETSWGNKPYHQAQKFSWDTVANQYETAFSKLLAA